jgi:peptidoglycan hydrolase-like protein with peptidoglycan-binding domain
MLGYVRARTKFEGIAGIIGLVAAVGCGGADDPTTGGDGKPALAAEIRRTLALGMEGDDVVTLNTALSSSGYFPNADLQEAYPSWRPIIGESPASSSTFGEVTQQAVLAFQRNSGLPPTGEADGVTVARLLEPGCAVPDGIPAMDPSSKFFAGAGLGKSVIKYKVYDTDTAELTLQQTQAAIGFAFGKWAAETNLSAQLVTSGEDIKVAFRGFVGGGTVNVGGVNVFVGSPGNSAQAGGNVILFNSNMVWSAAPGGNLQKLAVHEVGHILGLGHSPFGGSAMRKSAPTVDLGSDDIAGISVLYDAWERVDGNSSFVADDVAVIPFGEGPLWARSTAGKVHRQVGRGPGSTWTEVPLPGGATANRITVDSNGSAWAVTSPGDVYCRTNADGSGTWKKQPGCAANIAAGRDGQLWMAACPQQGGRRIFKWGATALCSFDSGGLFDPWIEANPLPEATQWHLAVGRWSVWAIDTSLNVWYRDTTNPVDGTQWVKKQVVGPFGAWDIAVDWNERVWATDVWHYGIWTYNSQPCLEADEVTACPNGRTPTTDGSFFQDGWVRMAGSQTGFALTAGGPQQLSPLAPPRNGPIIIDQNNKIFRTTR